MTTNLTPWNGLDVEKLKVWVHRILPLVYDDSLSYYEVLAKVGSKMNEVIEGLNANNEQVEKVTGFTIEQVKNLTLAFNNFQQSMLTRQETFETKVLDSQHSFETQLLGDIAKWESDTEEKFRAQYEQFLSDYQKQFGVVQKFGDSITDVLSQKFSTDNTFIPREQISDISTIDELTSPGVYYFIDTYNAANYDIHAGTLLVFTASRFANNFTAQIIIPSSALTIYFVRIHYSNGWGNWNLINTSQNKNYVESDIQGYTANYLNKYYVGGRGQIVDQNSIDTTFNSGIYAINSLTTPTTIPSTLLVINAGQSDNIYTYQILIPTRGNIIYYRLYTTKGWDIWRKNTDIFASVYQNDDYSAYTTKYYNDHGFVPRQIINDVEQLNTLTLNGVYSVGNILDFDNIKNGTVVVFSPDASNFTTQLLFPNPFNGNLYYRLKGSHEQYQTWKKLNGNYHDNNTSFYNKKIVFGGDSITYGAGGSNITDGDLIIHTESRDYYVNKTGYCWCNLLCDLINTNFNSQAVNHGCGGTGAVFWANNIATLVPADTDVFVLTIGTNDKYISLGEAYNVITNSFRAIKEYCNSNNITFIAVSPIPSTKTDEADATVPTFVMNELIKNACIMLGITYKDLYNKCFNNYISNEGVGTFSDNKHPDDKMYYNMYYMYCDLLDIGAKYLPKPV